MSRRRAPIALLVVAMASSSSFTTNALLAADDRQGSETDREQARRLVALGDEKMATGDFRAAYDAYRGADVLMGVPTTGLQVARVELAMGRLIEARATLDRVLGFPASPDEPAVFATARQRAAELRETLGTRIPKLSVTVVGVPNGKQAQVTVDGTTWTTSELGSPQAINPGQHEVSAWLEGRTQVSRRVEIPEGQQRVVELVIPTAPSPPGSGALSPLVPIGFGAGAAGLAVGIVMGILSLDRASEVKDGCFDGRICPRSLEQTRDESLVFAHVATGGFILAGAGIVVGVIGLAVSGGRGRQARAAPSPSAATTHWQLLF